jgi:CubicO group peptidase (beta-lactamase class C family)
MPLAPTSLATAVLIAVGLASTGPVAFCRPASGPGGVRSLMARAGVPGLSMAVVRGGRVAWSGAFGVASAVTKAPVTEETIFEAASLSKPVFAYAVLRLADEGRIDLDAPLTTYLPTPYVAGDERLALITARRVLTHTSGFPNWRPRGRPLEIRFTPGERFSYSGEGFVYLQRAVEKIAGEPLDAVMRRLVFEPLGMARSSYVFRPEFEGAKAVGHDRLGVATPLRRPAEALAPASLHTTAREYALFLAAALRGEGLRPETAREMFRPEVVVGEGCIDCTDRAPERRSATIAWALGWGTETSGSRTFVWQWGDNNGDTNALVMGDPTSRDGVVVLTNSGYGSSIMQDLVLRTLGGEHTAFRWYGAERFDAPVPTFVREVARLGARRAIARNGARGGRALTESEMNQLGYMLLGDGRVADAVDVFEANAAAHPDSFNVFDSLGEAVAALGDRRRAAELYRRSLALNPANENARRMLERLGERP